MKKLFAVVALAAALLAFEAWGGHPNAVAEVPGININYFNALIDQTNFIVNGGCSGTLIDKVQKLVITAGHCVDEKVITKDITGYGPTGILYHYKTTEYRSVSVDNPALKKFFIGKIIKYSAPHFASPPNNGENDLALIQLDTDIPLADLGITMEAHFVANDYPVIRGEKIYTVGNPMRLWGTLREGIISFVYRDGSYGSDNTGMQFDGGMFYGNSGGSLYNANYELLGVTTQIGVSTVGYDPTEGFAVPYWIVNDFINPPMS